MITCGSVPLPAATHHQPQLPDAEPPMANQRKVPQDRVSALNEIMGGYGGRRSRWGHDRQEATAPLHIDSVLVPGLPPPHVADCPGHYGADAQPHPTKRRPSASAADGDRSRTRSECACGFGLSISELRGPRTVVDMAGECADHGLQHACAVRGRMDARTAGGRPRRDDRAMSCAVGVGVGAANALVVAARLETIPADLHRAPPCRVRLAAIEQEQAALLVGASP